MRTVSKNEAVKQKAQRMNDDLVMGFMSSRSAAAQILDLFLASQQGQKRDSK